MIKNIKFSQWLSAETHRNHKDEWFRILYPFHVFREINFSRSLVGRPQVIFINNTEYIAVTGAPVWQESHQTFKIFIEIETSSNTDWNTIPWNEQFYITYTKEYQFKTLVAKNDTSKDCLKKFLKGNFKPIEKIRSLPISDLLFRTLIKLHCQKLYPTGELNRTFDITDAANSELIKITPFYSIQQDLWIFETFFEDTAHRLGIYFGGYCGRLIAVYCQPVYSKHHRCAQINTEILSLREFVNFAETGFIPLVSNQVRILQNNLCDPLIPKPPDLLHEILSPQQDFYQIDDYLLLEALSVSEPYSFGTYDIFYFLASSNLLNAWCSINRAKVLTNKQRRNLKQCYSFKSNISRFLAKTTSIDNPDVRIYCGDDLCIIEVLNFQFSFHGIALNRELKAYSKSNKNAVIEWKGKKLQPVAPLLMKYAISLIEN